MFLLIPLYALFLGYITAKIFAGPHEHTRGIFKALILHFRKLKIHMHHWMTGLIIASIFIIIKLNLKQTLTPYDLGFLWFFIGIIFQGIIDYDDWREIIIQN